MVQLVYVIDFNFNRINSDLYKFLKKIKRLLFALLLFSSPAYCNLTEEGAKKMGMSMRDLKNSYHDKQDEMNDKIYSKEQVSIF